MPRALEVVEVYPGLGGRSLALAPDATWAACDGLTVTVHRATETIGRVPSPGRLLFGLAFSPGGDVLVAAPRVLDLAGMRWRDDPDPVRAATAGLDASVAAAFAIHDAAVSPDASRMVIRAEYRPRRGGGGSAAYPTVRVVTGPVAGPGGWSVFWEGRGATFTALAASADRVAAAWTAIDVWAADGTPVSRIPGDGAAVRALALTADGRLLAAGFADGSALFGAVDLAGGLPRPVIGRGHVGAIAVAPGGGHALAGGEDGVLTLLGPGGETLGALQAGAPVTALAADPLGDRYLAATGTPSPGVLMVAVV